MQVPVAFLIVTNANGRAFGVRVVSRGDRYGRDRCLTHKEDEELLEFYDRKYAGQPGFDAEGQFVSRYYADTLARHRGGLALDCGIPEWSVDASAMATVIDLAKFLRAERARKAMACG